MFLCMQMLKPLALTNLICCVRHASICSEWQQTNLDFSYLCLCIKCFVSYCPRQASQQRYVCVRDCLSR